MVFPYTLKFLENHVDELVVDIDKIINITQSNALNILISFEEIL